MVKRGFTLLELLTIVVILAVLATVGVGTIRAGQGAARIKGATRDIFAAIRQARSVALVTGQPAIITYSTGNEDGEPVAKVEITSTRLMGSSVDLDKVQTLSGEPLKQPKRDAVIIEEEGDAETSVKGKCESDEEIMFAPMDTEVVKGMRLKVVTGDEAEDEPVRYKPRISVFSNVDFLLGKFNSARDAAKKQEESADKKEAQDEAEGAEDVQPPVSVVWETNGRVDAHKVWVYPDGKKPEDGLMIKIDRFGAAKVLLGDGRESEL